MFKLYKDHCRIALNKNPEKYESTINLDGSIKPLLGISKFGRKKVLRNIPEDELQKMKKDGWKPAEKKEESELEITGTEIKIKGRKLNLEILELPKKINRKEYNRIWMHNSRVRQHIKELKAKYGDEIPL